MKRTTLLISAVCMLILANILMMSYASPAFLPNSEGFSAFMDKTEEEKKAESFANYAPGGAKDSYQPIGAFDGVRLAQGNEWRHTSPNEPLQGKFPKFELGPDQLFMFKDNQVKPECCAASYSSYGGCVCTTPEQRNYINMRGGNRTGPDAGV
jgi:hypothetical protein